MSSYVCQVARSFVLAFRPRRKAARGASLDCPVEVARAATGRAGGDWGHCSAGAAEQWRVAARRSGPAGLLEAPQHLLQEHGADRGLDQRLGVAQQQLEPEQQRLRAFWREALGTPQNLVELDPDVFDAFAFLKLQQLCQRGVSLGAHGVVVGSAERASVADHDVIDDGDAGFPVGNHAGPEPVDAPAALSLGE